MDKKIYLPSTEQARQMIENAWQQCKKQAEEAGLDLSNPELESFAQDMFVAGYAYGHNDCLGVISGQLEAMNIVTDMFGGN